MPIERIKVNQQTPRYQIYYLIDQCFYNKSLQEII